jgi:hypothetical protein
MGPVGCNEMSVIDWHYSLHNNPEEFSSYLLCGRSLKSCFRNSYVVVFFIVLLSNSHLAVFVVVVL